MFPTKFLDKSDFSFSITFESRESWYVVDVVVDNL